MNENQAFEMPKQMREMAEKNVEQAHAGFSQFMDGMSKATSMWLCAMPANKMTAGFRVMHERNALFSKQNADACFACASEMVVAKDVSDVLAIQSRFVQSQMQAYTTQVQEMAKSMASAGQPSPSTL